MLGGNLKHIHLFFVLNKKISLHSKYTQSWAIKTIVSGYLLIADFPICIHC